MGRSWARERLDRVRSVPVPERLILVALVGIALLARYAGRHYTTSDMVVFADWYDQLRAHGGVRGLSEPIGNYNAPFLYLLALATYLPGATMLKIKAIFVAFDALLIYFVYRIVALRHDGWRLPTLAALVTALLPTVVVNASMYGQCDAIWAAFGVGGLYFFLRDRPWVATACLAAAYAFKPQGVFLFPLLVLLILAGRVRWRTLLALPVVYLALDLPAILLGRDPGELLTLYTQQLEDPGALVRSGPSVFRFLPVTVGTDVLRDLGYLFAAALVLGICYALVSTGTPLDPTRIVTAAACFVILVPYVLPSMHERYFYLADVLTVVLAFHLPRLWYVPVIVQAASALSYLPFLFRGGPHGPYVDAKVLATLMFAALLITGHRLLHDVADHATTPAPESRPNPPPDVPDEPSDPVDRVAEHQQTS